MRQRLCRDLAAISLILACHSKVSICAEVPPEAFSIGAATVGITTLADVQNVYGMAKTSRVGREDGADVQVCYTYNSPKARSFLVFESGVMGSYQQITGFRISTIRPAKNCVPTKIDIATLKTGNGIQLQQSLDDFKKAIQVKFRRHDSELIYEAVDRRAATQEELKKIRSQWPNEKQDYFDVTITLKAKFKDNRLVEFYSHKIESY